MKKFSQVPSIFISTFVFIAGCQHSIPEKRYVCDDVERNARSSQGLMDWASNDGEADVKRQASAELQDSSDDPGLKYDCSASTESASTLKGEKE